MKFQFARWKISGLDSNPNLFEVPVFQREKEIWTKQKKRLFIDTILKGWKIPKIYLYVTPEQHYEIIDGQQRLFTILQFLENGFEIELLDKKTADYKSLEPGLQNQIQNYELDIELVSDANEEEISDLFSRLQEGVALNAAEKLNALTGKLADFINVMAEHPFFEKSGFRKKRFGIKSLCQQLCVLEARGIGSAKYPAVREYFEANRNTEDKIIQNKITKTLDFLNEIFEQEEEFLTKSGNILSIYLLCSWMLSKEVNLDAKKIYHFFSKFYENWDEKRKSDKEIIEFYLTLLQSTADAPAIKLRDDTLKRHLYLYEPSLLKLLDSESKIKFYATMEDSFSLKTELMQNLMGEINQRTIANGNHTVFNVTSEISLALNTMSRRIKNSNDYKKFVEQTWKAFYEGSQSGNRITTVGNDDREHKKPTNQLHIVIKLNDLRTVEAHDPELNRETFEETIQNACKVRELYTKKKLVNDFDEDDFLSFQNRVINEILEFLTQYNESMRP